MDPSSPASPDAEPAVADRNHVAVTRTAYHRYVRPAASRAAHAYQNYVRPTAKRMAVTAYGKYLRPAATAAYQKYLAAPAATPPATPTDAERAAAAAAESAAAYQKYVAAPAATAAVTPPEGKNAAPNAVAADSGDKVPPDGWSPAVG